MWRPVLASYRGISFIRNTPLLGPYSRNIPRVIWCRITGPRGTDASRASTVILDGVVCPETWRGVEGRERGDSAVLRVLATNAGWGKLGRARFDTHL